jgi:putative transposase
MREQGIPVRVICRGFGLSRATLYRYLASPVSHDLFSKRITELSYEHPQYGNSRISVLLIKEGSVVNYKKVYRLYTRLSLQKEVKRSRKIRTRVPVHLTQPEFPAYMWSADFDTHTDDSPEFRETTLNCFLSNGRINHEFIVPGKPQ